MPNENELESDYYGCFNCLSVEGHSKSTPEGRAYCAECGEDTLLTMSAALELIQSLYWDGRIYPQGMNGHDVMGDYDESDDDPKEGDIEESYEDDYDDE